MTATATKVTHHVFSPLHESSPITRAPIVTNRARSTRRSRTGAGSSSTPRNSAHSPASNPAGPRIPMKTMASKIPSVPISPRLTSIALRSIWPPMVRPQPWQRGRVGLSSRATVRWHPAE